MSISVVKYYLKEENFLAYIDKLKKYIIFVTQQLGTNMTIDCKFDLGKTVWVKELECYGKVLGIFYDSLGVQYLIRYLTDGEYKTAYLFASELSSERN